MEVHLIIMCSTSDASQVAACADPGASVDTDVWEWAQAEDELDQAVTVGAPR